MIDKAKVLKSYPTLAAGAVALLAVASPGFAQNTVTPVGPPELRDFELPGTRTTPPPAQETPAPQPEVTPAPAPAEERQERPAPRRTEPAPAPATRQETVRRPEPAPQQATPEAAPPPAVPVTEAPITAAPAPAVPPSVAAPEPAPEPESGGVPWLYLLLAGVAGVVGFAVYRKVRSENRAEPVYAAPPAEPAPAPRPIPAKDPEAELRPRLELEFKPEKAAATETGATVNYQIAVKNLGKSDARNVRIEVRMFNAGKEQDREIGAFFAAEGSGQRIAAPFALPAQKQAKLERIVSMPRDQLREIEVQGRRLFVPMVAFNVLYDWGDGKTGQTSMSYIVGREAETPSEKMGAFRLDLGPRVYRSVGQRQTSLARIA